MPVGGLESVLDTKSSCCDFVVGSVVFIAIFSFVANISVRTLAQSVISADTGNFRRADLLITSSAPGTMSGRLLPAPEVRLRKLARSALEWPKKTVRPPAESWPE